MSGRTSDPQLDPRPQLSHSHSFDDAFGAVFRCSAHDAHSRPCAPRCATIPTPIGIGSPRPGDSHLTLPPPLSERRTPVRSDARRPWPCPRHDICTHTHNSITGLARASTNEKEETYNERLSSPRAGALTPSSLPTLSSHVPRCGRTLTTTWSPAYTGEFHLAQCRRHEVYSRGRQGCTRRERNHPK